MAYITNAELRERAARVLQKIIEKVEATDKQRRWTCIPGPLRAVVTTMSDLGWKLASPFEWLA